jgi:hypothetical protein
MDGTPWSVDGIMPVTSDKGGVEVEPPKWPAIDEIVYVAKLGDPRPGSYAKTCEPTTKKVAFVGLNVVIFEDLTDQAIDWCFPETDQGLAACRDWCKEIENNQQFKTGVRRAYWGEPKQGPRHPGDN